MRSSPLKRRPSQDWSSASAILSFAASHCCCETIAGDADELGLRAFDGEGNDPRDRSRHPLWVGGVTHNWLALTKRGRFIDSFGERCDFDGNRYRRKASVAALNPSSSALVPNRLSQETTVTSASSRVCFCCGAMQPADIVSSVVLCTDDPACFASAPSVDRLVRWRSRSLSSTRARTPPEKGRAPFPRNVLDRGNTALALRARSLGVGAGTLQGELTNNVVKQIGRSLLER